MKAMKELQELSRGELFSRLQELRKELMKLNVSRASGVNPANPGRVRLAKKSIARITMLLAQQPLQQPSQQPSQQSPTEAIKKP